MAIEPSYDSPLRSHDLVDPHDEVAYPVFANVHTHPDTLAVLGLLHGLKPAAVERCRVLEVGCNDGGNLIPMAYALPGSEFVGFDLAGAPVARGQERIRELGLANIRIFRADVMEVGAEVGVFDYIIAHGVYAWVPGVVRDRLLALCRERLAPEGVAFVSYNALPGGHVRHLVRDVLRAGIPADEDTVGGAEQAVEFFKFVAGCQQQGDPLRPLLEKQAKELERRGARVLVHDELCAAEEPVSFAAFAAHAGRHGLQYLSEAVLPPPNDPCYKPQVMAVVQGLSGGDAISAENLLDVVRMRMYRQTLLCHAERAVSREVSVEALGGLRLATQAVSEVGEGGARVYSLPGTLQMESRDATTMLLMKHLSAAWPEAVPFAEVAAVMEAHGIARDATFFTLLLRLLVARMIDLRAWAAPVSRVIDERPRASAISCEGATAGQARVATLLHTMLSLPDPLVRALLLLLDGTRDREELVEALAGAFPEVSAAALAKGFEPTLRLLHRAGVLLGEA